MVAEIDREKAKQNIDKALAGEHVIEESYSGDKKLSQKYFIITHSPIRNASGEVTGVVVVSYDISDHKKAEEELTKNQAKMEIMNEKLNVLGRLTRHDVGNKLMVMRSNIYLLKKQIGDNPKLAKNFEGIDSAINQSDVMFEFSRSYEKIGVEEPSEIDVAQCFNQAASLLPNFGTIKVFNDCQGLCVTADSLLKQLFYNFLDNSLKYGEKVTQIQLSYTKEKDRVKLSYEDNGVGIPEANKQKLFIEGFTTGKGTGLGLFLIKKMVEVYGWIITEEGEPNKGAKFVITIPKVNQKKN
jgi:signal transduction histidine kinase